ncbi:MAG: type II toxin-antitoxin system VapC family toxin [Tagaea sp.]|nr:type II toxin-antitoxin system VapC family toxin [Tagaea sp.]
MSGIPAVVDASVLVAIYAGELDAARWRASLSGFALHAPRIARMECAIAFSRKVRRGTLTSSQALASMAFIDRLGVAWSELDDAAIDRALMLSISVGHETADCVYLAMALAMKSPLATADAKLATVAARQGVQVLALSAA